MGKEKELQTIVDRYGIMSYEKDTTVIVVNKCDEQEAISALAEKQIICRTFEVPEKFAREVYAEKCLSYPCSVDEDFFVNQVLYREEFEKELAIDEAIDDNNITDTATDFLSEKLKSEEK